MFRALTRFNASPRLPPQHAGAPLRRGETVLMRVPGSFFDVKVELRGIDDDLALVHFRGLDRSEIVNLSWLRRP